MASSEIDSPTNPTNAVSTLSPGETWTSDSSIPGVAIRIYSAPAPYPLVVRSSEDLHWTLFTPLRNERSGINDIPTTVLYAGSAWCVDAASHNEGGAWIYSLRVWPETEAWYKTFELNAPAFQRRREEEKQQKKTDRRLQIAWTYEILVGILPARLQERLAERWQFDPEHASRKNALLHLYLFLPLGALLELAAFISADAFIPAFIACFLAFEGFIRWGHVLASNKPCGFIGFEALHWLLTRVLLFGKYKR
ncbi:TPA: hypothetical protein DDW35_08050 [Candidatus Sumerlaeota bacterium]|nr:hypothetical protein [Candidatus Sumerlaeota bacterium]